MGGFAMLIKKLLTGEASPDHLLTYLPGWVTAGSGPGA